MRNKPKLWKGMAAGMLGGIAASWIMDQFQALVSKAKESASESGSSNGKAQQQQSEPATVKAASAISENVLRHQLAKDEKEPAGQLMHYAMGAVSGGIYGALCEMSPLVSKGAGTLFGGAVWLAADEIAVPALGLSPGPTEVPLSSHVEALASHLVYGVGTDVARRGLRKLM